MDRHRIPQNTFFLLTILLLAGMHSAQAQLTRHIVEFTDKKATPFSISSPTAYLSGKAIERRNRYKISIDSTDLPVCKAYVDSVLSVRNVIVLNSSKWLNQVAIQTTDPKALLKIKSFPFVKNVAAIASRSAQITEPSDTFNEDLIEVPNGILAAQGSEQHFFNYGNSFGQVHIHEGEILHDKGFRGEGMTIAILDAGYFSYLTNPAFDSLRRNNQILGTWDFVKSEAAVNEDDQHGANCFAIIAANLPGVMVGTAPKASFYLFRTEDAATEYPVEEHFWAAGAERADSLGADMISSSLGYTTYDAPSLSHSYAKMDGNTTMVTRAADMAVRKGMIVTNSAGNSGTSSWKYIGAPADGDSVFSIGAVDVNGVLASFSSFGPTADGRIKPDVSSVGLRTFTILPNGAAAQGNGTSYSNPNMAGLIACLWQAFPEFSNMEVLEAVKRSASLHATPDNRMGHGIPNMGKAYEYLYNIRQVRNANRILEDKHIKCFPSPFTDRFTIIYKAAEAGKPTFEMIDMSGRIIRTINRTAAADEILFMDIDGLGSLQGGAYFIRYRDGERKGTVRLLK